MTRSRNRRAPAVALLLALPLLLAVAALLAAACGDDEADAPVAAGGGEAAAVAFTGSGGASLYAQACARCHGAELQGTDEGPPFLDAVYVPGHHADAAFLLAVRNGARAHHWNFGDMPRIEGLSDEQVAAIVAFVREQQRAAGFD